MDRLTLERFRSDWKLHHPLDVSQLEFSDQIGVVDEIGFYHGGYELYKLRDIPGIWHEVCLESVD